MMLNQVIPNAKILLVDDEAPNIRYLERILQQAGATHLTSTTDASQVLTLYQGVQPDLLVLDLMMPYMDGFEVMKQIAPLLPADGYQPILVITADVAVETKRRALGLGAKDFLTKPFDPVEGLLRMQHLLEIRFLHRQLEQRIAQHIHDGPLQDLGVLLLNIERCRREIQAGAQGDALTSLARLRSEVQDTINLLRSVVSDLRPPLVEMYGLLGGIDYLVGRLRRETNLVVHFTSRIGSRLDLVLEGVVFSLVQEALTNIRKHAQAHHTWILLERHGGELYLEVRDDGRGFAVEGRLYESLATGHIGLSSMYEQAAQRGGRLTVESSPGKGTVLHCVLPFQAAGSDTDVPLSPLGEP